MNVRLEETGDRAASLEVERLAFGHPEEAAIVEAVRDLPGSFALVALSDDGVVVGQVQMSRAWIGETEVLALGPIGVRPERQREGIGSSLVRAALDRAKHRGETAVILLGSPAYYGRFGFASGASLGLRNPHAGVRADGFEILEEDFQVAIIDESMGSLRGDVRWHPAFGEIG